MLLFDHLFYLVRRVGDQVDSALLDLIDDLLATDQQIPPEVAAELLIQLDARELQALVDILSRYLPRSPKDQNDQWGVP